MNFEKTGAMIARAAGLALIIMGASAFLYFIPWMQPGSTATSGWTSYSPNGGSTTTTPDLMSHLHDTYYIVSSAFSSYIPNAAQILAGFSMILLSRPIGRWLAKGLNEKSPDDAE